MAAPAEVSKRRSNFRIRQFEGKRHFNIATNVTLNTMAYFVILLIARTARIACADIHTYIHTYTRDKYCNLSAHARRGFIIIETAVSAKRYGVTKIVWVDKRSLFSFSMTGMADFLVKKQRSRRNLASLYRSDVIQVCSHVFYLQRTN